MLQVKNYTTRAYWPRTDILAVKAPAQTLDVVYSVWRQTDDALANVEVPPDSERFSLVYFHSSQLTKEVWNYQIELAFKAFGPRLNSAVTIDAVFHGDSALINKDKVGFLVAWEDMARDGANVIRDAISRGEIIPNSPVIAVGHSMGGGEVLFMSVHDPSLVDAAIVYDPVYGFPDIESPIPDKFRNFVASRLGSIAAAVFKNARDTFSSLDEYHEFMNTKFVSRTFHPRIRQDVVDNLAVVHPDGTVTTKHDRAQQAASYLSLVMNVEAGGTIFKFNSTPTLVVVGDICDWNTAESNPRLVAEVLQNAQLKTVPGGGHNIVYQRPQESFDATKQFISDQVDRAIAERKASAATLKTGGSQYQQFESLIARIRRKEVIRRSKI